MHVLEETYYHAGPICGGGNGKRCDGIADEFKLDPSKRESGHVAFTPKSPPKYNKNSVCLLLKYTSHNPTSG